MGPTQLILSVSNVFLWCLVLALAFAVFTLYRLEGIRQLSTPGGRLNQGPPRGSRLSVEILDSLGMTESWSNRAENIEAVLVLVTHKNCRACRALYHEMREFRRPDIMPIAVVGGGKLAESAHVQDVLGGYWSVVGDPDARLARRLEVVATPYMLLITLDGRLIAGESPRTVGQLADFLVRSFINDEPPGGRTIVGNGAEK